MSEQNRSDDPHGNSTRVGNDERDRAVALLAEHWHAGRLDPAEHEARVTRARAAVTRGDLNVLFADLPQTDRAPEPTRDGASGEAHGWGNPRETIMALAPFAALALFFITQSWFAQAWLWFLLIPVMGLLLYGPRGRRYPRQR